MDFTVYLPLLIISGDNFEDDTVVSDNIVGLEQVVQVEIKFMGCVEKTYN
jgi:hypothetical protein